MKEEVEQLRRKLELVKASAPDPESTADEIAAAAEQLDAKEKELYKLQAEEDDKVRGRVGCMFWQLAYARGACCSGWMDAVHAAAVGRKFYGVGWLMLAVMQLPWAQT